MVIGLVSMMPMAREHYRDHYMLHQAHIGSMCYQRQARSLAPGAERKREREQMSRAQNDPTPLHSPWTHHPTSKPMQAPLSPLTRPCGSRGSSCCLSVVIRDGWFACRDHRQKAEWRVSERLFISLRVCLDWYQHQPSTLVQIVWTLSALPQDGFRNSRLLRALLRRQHPRPSVRCFERQR